jgi:predicted HTH transcriptional regulator
MLPPSLKELIDYDAATLRVQSRESKTREFKQEITTASLSDYTKTLAAFANADGGVLVFGVSDKPRKVVGIDPATIIDEARWVDRLREDFHPEIPLQAQAYAVRDITIFVVAVDQNVERPVICRKGRSKRIVSKGREIDTEVLREGTI